MRLILAGLLVFLLISPSLGANAWVSNTSPTARDLNDVQFVSASTGYAVGGYATVIKTTNYGKTWTKLTDSSVNSPYIGMYFISSQIGYAVGTNLQADPNFGISVITDNGFSSSTSNLPAEATLSLNDVFYLDQNTGWIAGRAAATNIWYTINGGTNWTSDRTNPLNGVAVLYGVYAINSQNVWAVGAEGHIARTTDGGANWTNPTSGTANQLNEVFFVSATTGWVVGNSGTILKSADNGATWAAQTSGTANNLNAVHFVDANNGWVVGDSETILKTTDGGTSWAAETSGTNANLNGVHFTDINNGCAVGAGGVILKYVLNPTITSLKHGRFTTFSQGGIYTQATITGTGFNSSLVPDATFNTDKITGGSVTSFTDTTIVAPLSFASDIPPTSDTVNYTVTLTNPGGGRATHTIQVLADSVIPMSFTDIKANGEIVTSGMTVNSPLSLTGNLKDPTGISINPTDDLEFTLTVTDSPGASPPNYLKSLPGSSVYSVISDTKGSFIATPNKFTKFSDGVEKTLPEAVGLNTPFYLNITATDKDGNPTTYSLYLKFAGLSPGEKTISNVLVPVIKNPTAIPIQFESKENLGIKELPIFSPVGMVSKVTANIVTGTNKVTWDVRTFSGSKAPAGLYIIMLPGNVKGKIPVVWWQ